jgi:hypothetical protein
MLAQKGGEADEPALTPRSDLHHEIAVGWDMGQNTRTGFVHGPRAGYAYAWKNVALAIGGGADFASRSLESKDESLVGGYGRAGVELRLPLGALTLRGGAGGRAGVLAQTIRSTSALLRTSDQSNTALVFGPEVLVAARLALGDAWFADLGATGSILFLREAETLRGIPGAVFALALGARF